MGLRLIEYGEVVRTIRINDRTFRTSFKAPEIARAVKAGQFVMLGMEESIDPLLPRAFSVCDVRDEKIELLYVAVGKATSRIAHMRPGERVRLIGPLGNGFPDVGKMEDVWIVVGGSGAAILPILTKSIYVSGGSFRIFYGARSRKELIEFEDIATEIATDDGSYGFKGNVVELAGKELSKSRPEKIFVCGPTPMLKAAQIQFANFKETYISVETPMACGIGLCQGCAVKNKKSGDYFLACKDGPVFRSDDVVLDE